MKRTLKSAGVAALVVCLVLVLAFPEVIFKSGSLAPSHISRELGYPETSAPVTVYPNPFGKNPFVGMIDVGAGSWQLEPGQWFMAHSLKSGESPFWNPYSASGSLGPESLVDMKFSPLSLIVAFAGPGAGSFTWAVLGILFVSGLCFFLALHSELGLSRWASGAGTAVFLLNGFSVSHLINQIAQPYYLSAVVFFALLAYLRNPQSSRWVLLVFSHLPILLSTFLPVSVICLAAVHLSGLCFSLAHRDRAVHALGWQALSAVAAFCLLAPLWFPILASLKIGMMVDMYQRREVGGASWSDIGWLFAPRHFRDSHAFITYQGVFTVLAAGLALVRPGARRAVVAGAAAVVLVSFFRLFGSVLTRPLDLLPFAKIIQPQYWQSAAAFGVALLCAVGLECLPRRWKIGAAVCVVLELLSIMNHVRPERYDLSSKLPRYVGFLRANLGYNRVFNIGRERTLFPEWGSALRIQHVGSMMPATLPWYHRFFRRCFGIDDNDLFLVTGTLEDKGLTINEAALDLIAVRYIVVRKNFAKAVEWFSTRGYSRVFEDENIVILLNGDALPRAYSVTALAAAEKTPEASGLAARDIAVSDDARFIAEARAAGVPEKLGRAQMLPEMAHLREYENTRVELFAEVSAPSVLVLSDGWHPGWRAYVDGKEAYVGRVNEAFRGVVLPTGQHEVEFRYTPIGFQAGLAAALCSALTLLGVILFGARYQPR